jgi:hypothetical protein
MNVCSAIPILERAVRVGRGLTHHDPASTRDISTGYARSNPRSRLSQSSGLLRVSLVQSQRRHECRRLAGRNAGAVFVSQNGLHGLRPDRSRCAAGLVAAYEQAAVVIRPLRGSSHAKPDGGIRSCRGKIPECAVRGARASWPDGVL